MEKTGIFVRHGKKDVVTIKLREAKTFWQRFCGLMGQKSLPDNTGILLLRCGSVHCFFMRFTIDVVYLDKNMTVIGTETIKPWHIGKIVRGAKHTLELPENMAADICLGDTLRISEELEDRGNNE